MEGELEAEALWQGEAVALAVGQREAVRVAH